MAHSQRTRKIRTHTVHPHTWTPESLWPRLWTEVVSVRQLPVSPGPRHGRRRAKSLGRYLQSGGRDVLELSCHLILEHSAGKNTYFRALMRLFLVITTCPFSVMWRWFETLYGVDGGGCAGGLPPSPEVSGNNRMSPLRWEIYSPLPSGTLCLCI